jgi:hypothetical protein
MSPRFRVVKRRTYDITYLIKADDEAAAHRFDGDIIDESGCAFNAFPAEVLDVQQVADDEVEA